MIYCVGRNYVAHAKELGNETTDKPIIFFKPPKSIIYSDKEITLPHFSKNVQFEVELALKLGENLKPNFIAVANDLTARDVQKEAQEKGRPWSLGKGFKQSCGLGNWAPVNPSFGKEFENLELKLIHNGKTAQYTSTAEMVFPPSSIIEYLSENFPLTEGDIILTGTPEGVARVAAGDEIHAVLIFKDHINEKIISSGAWKFSC